MREFGAGMRLFGQALLGYGVEDRTRYVSDFYGSKRLDTTTHAVSLGASIGIGRKFAPDQIALSFMPQILTFFQIFFETGFMTTLRKSPKKIQKLKRGWKK